MMNQGRLTQDNKAAAIDTLRRMTAYAKTKNVMVGAEPRGDDFTLLTEVVRGGGAYTNPDVGNFGGDQVSPARRHQGDVPLHRRQLSHEDAGSACYDLAAAIALIKQLGYTGLYSIENEQAGDPYDNVQKVYDVVVANI